MGTRPSPATVPQTPVVRITHNPMEPSWAQTFTLPPTTKSVSIVVGPLEVGPLAQPDTYRLITPKESAVAQLATIEPVTATAPRALCTLDLSTTGHGAQWVLTHTNVVPQKISFAKAYLGELPEAAWSSAKQCFELRLARVLPPGEHIIDLLGAGLRSFMTMTLPDAVALAEFQAEQAGHVSVVSSSSTATRPPTARERLTALAAWLSYWFHRWFGDPNAA